jgi:hypothetical protein
MLTLRWNAPWGSGRARLSGLCVWNEVQSQGWSDPSPVLPNRYAGAPYTPAQMATYAGAIADLMLGAGRGAALGTPAGQDPPMLWLSTDHFNTAPPLSAGDVMHVGLWELLDALGMTRTRWEDAWDGVHLLREANGDWKGLTSAMVTEAWLNSVFAKDGGSDKCGGGC